MLSAHFIHSPVDQNQLILHFELLSEYDNTPPLYKAIPFDPEELLWHLLTCREYIDIYYSEFHLKPYPITSAKLYQAFSNLDKQQRIRAYGFDPLDFEKEEFLQYFNSRQDSKLSLRFSHYFLSGNNETLLQTLETASYTRNLFSLRALFMVYPDRHWEIPLLQEKLLTYTIPTISVMKNIHCVHLKDKRVKDIVLHQAIFYTPQFLEFVLYERNTSPQVLYNNHLYKRLYQENLCLPVEYQMVQSKLRQIIDLYLRSNYRGLQLLAPN